MRSTVVGAGLLVWIVCMSPAHSQAAAVPQPCDRDPDVCMGLRDSGPSNSSGGIGSRRGTGGEGTNAVRPPDELSPRPAIPNAPNLPRLPNVPRRF